MFDCVRRMEFDAAHRVIGHEGKCKYLHGHRYCLELSISSNTLDQIGMVIDFGKMKSIVKEWIDHNLDHNLILSEQDYLIGQQVSEMTGQNVYYIKNNPTAENIALHLKYDILPKLLFPEKKFKINVTLYETPSCFVRV